MIRAALPLCAFGFALALSAVGANSSGVQTVYVFPMANGLDQYLASRLTSSGVFQVTTDPKKADAVFTDRIGQAFEQQLENLVRAEPEKPGGDSQGDPRAAQHTTTFARGKGTLFLVDSATRAVLWSAYEPAKNTTPGELNRAAQRVVDALKKIPKR